MRVIGIDVPGFGVPTHAEAKDVLAACDAEVRRAREVVGRAGAGAEERRALGEAHRRRCWARCSRPIRSIIGMMLEPMGLAAGPVVPTREWRELYAALDGSGGRGAASVLHRQHPRIRGGRAGPIVRLGAGRTRRHRSLAAGDRHDAANVGTGADRRGEEPHAAGDPRRVREVAGQGSDHAQSGYEGSELLVGRLLVESGADLRYVGKRLSGDRSGTSPIADWLRSQGVSMCSSAPRSSRTSRRCTSGSPMSPSAPRRSSRRRRNAAIAGALFHEPDLGATVDGSGRRGLARAP